MKKQLPAWAVLCIIALASGLLLGATNELTYARIDAQQAIAANEARLRVLPEASEFEAVEVPSDAGLINCFAGMRGGAAVGYVSTAAVKGYGGEIEVTVGMDLNGVITGIDVGGPNFSETAGLGGKAKDAWFSQQFIGITPPAVRGENVDGITAATITTGAVISGVNACAEYMQGLRGGTSIE